MINEIKLDEMIKKGCLLTAGNINEYNTMTIGWGMIGTIWRKKTFIVYVKPCRYTYSYMENNDYFTVSFYNDEYASAMAYLGTKSGRDCNKVFDVDFHPLEIDNSISFKEAYCTIVCKKYYYTDINKDNVPEESVDRYYKDNCLHRVYYGEIISINYHK